MESAQPIGSPHFIESPQAMESPHTMVHGVTCERKQREAGGKRHHSSCCDCQGIPKKRSKALRRPVARPDV